MSFTLLFYKHIMFRHSCVKCHYTNTRRPSDITLADFWGWEKTDPDFNKDNRGCSLILINTEKGLEIFNNIKDKLNYLPADLDNCLQPNLQKPSSIHKQRDEFEKDYIKHGFKYVMYKYGEIGIKYRIKNRIKCILNALFITNK
jgi:hypothetical protein